MMLIGSHAMNFHLNKEHRNPMDIDLICSYGEFVEQVEFHKGLGKKVVRMYPFSEGRKWVAMFNDNTVIEAEITWEGSTAESLMDLIDRHDPCDRYGDRASLDILYTLKMSHRYLKNSPHFLKTMTDIKTMRKYGAKIPEYLEEWFKVREAETYDYGHPKLNVSKGEFFSGDGVDYKYDHDSLHEVLALELTPAYTKYMKDDSPVMVDMVKFENLDMRTKLLGGLEESLVLTAERSLIPFEFNPDPDEMFRFALMKVCSSITSGRFREFCWENYDAIVDIYENECKGVWVDKLKHAIENKELKKWVENSTT